MTTSVCPACGAPVLPGRLCSLCLLQLGEQASGATGAATLEDPCSSREVTGARIGRYKLLERIGEGGFGEVWMAEQEQPVRRRVALKIIKLGMDTRQVVARFEAERQALAMMDHPNIARVFDGGATENGRPFFVMELVRGLPLTQVCDARKLSTRDRLELFMQVCAAVQHAHQKGIIHRDLKPSNILVTEQDGRLTPKVIDFGIAKATEQPLVERTLFTRFNQMLGTPAYMSPEQTGLGGLDIDTRSDVYSLGVLLYELLTGRTPFDSGKLLEAGMEAFLKTIREVEPPKPSTRIGTLSREELTAVAGRRSEDPTRLTRLLRGELDWIVLKAIEKDRGRRYDSANAFAGDLQRYLNHEPVHAAPASPAYQAAKFARRHRVALATTTAFAVVLIAGTAISSWQAWRAMRLAISEAELRKVAERVQEQQRQLLYASEVAVAFKAWELGQAPRTRRILDALQPKSTEPDLRGWEWYYLWGQSRPSEVAILSNQPSFVGGLTYSPDGTRLAVGYGGGSVQLWDTPNRRLLRETMPDGGTVDRLIFTPDGSGLLVTSRQTNFHLLDAATLDLRETFRGHAQRVGGATLNASGQVLVSVGGDIYGQVDDAETFVWDFPRREVVFRLPPSPVFSYSPRVSPSGRFLALGLTRTGRIEIWDLLERKKIADFRAHSGQVFGTDFSPDETRLASVGEDGFVRLWDWRQQRELAILGRHAAPALDLEFAPDGSRLVTCGMDGAVRVWDPNSFAELAKLSGHLGRVHHLSFSPDGRWIASGGTVDMTIRIWDADSRSPHTLLDQQGQTPASLEFVGQGSILALARPTAGGARLKLWRFNPDRTGTNQILPALSTPQPGFAVVGTNLAIISSSNTVHLLDPHTSRRVAEFASPYVLTGPLVASRDSRLLACRTAGGPVVIWEPASRALPQELPLASLSGIGERSTLLFSVDGGRLWAAQSGANSIQSWDVPGAKLAGQIDGHTRPVVALALSPDGTILVSGSLDMTARLWDSVSGDFLGLLPGESGGVMSLAFSPDGRTLAMGCFDGQIKLWNVATRVEVATIPAHRSIVNSVAFSKDGTKLASASYDGTTRLWEAPKVADAPALQKSL